MKYFFILGIAGIISCNNTNTAPEVQNQPAAEKPNFFPVTSYLKGQVYDINQKGLTPVKYTTINNHTDSEMVKLDKLGGMLTAFLQPEIDSTNLVALYKESKFLDQTTNAFTFSYDPKTKLPDSVALLHWDVYVDPESGKVKRIYMVKKGAGNKTLQLTWQSNEWCKTVTIATDAGGNTAVEKEEKISWDY